MTSGQSCMHLCLAPRPARLLLAGAMAAVLLLGGCESRDADHGQVSAEELVLLDRLTRDPFVEIVDKVRGDDGYLVVTTRQGDRLAYYLIAPDGPASRQLRIRRMDEDFSIEAGIQQRPGTGPDPRGIGP